LLALRGCRTRPGPAPRLATEAGRGGVAARAPLTPSVGTARRSETRLSPTPGAGTGVPDGRATIDVTTAVLPLRRRRTLPPATRPPPARRRGSAPTAPAAPTAAT